MDRFALFQFLILLFALPAQYFISEYWSNNPLQRTYALKELINNVQRIKADYFNSESWKRWYKSFVIDLPKANKYRQNKFDKIRKLNANNQESVAYEVFKYRKTLENFAESSAVRTIRDEKIKYKVGQVVKHAQHGIQGVIIGWDYAARAPEEWLDQTYQLHEKLHKADQPHYLILTDSNYHNRASLKAYLAQDDIELVQKDTKIDNPLLNSYFNTYDGYRYTPKEFLKLVYPNDN